MAFPFLLAGALLGGGTSLLGGIMGNKATKRQAAAQRAAEEIRASSRRDANAKTAQRNIGSLSSGSGDRNAFGRSSKAIIIGQLTAGAKSEESIAADRDFRLLSIAQNAANNKVDLFSSTVQGVSGGLSLGKDLGTLFG